VPEITSRSFRQAAESGHPEPLTAGALTLYPRWFPTQFGFVAGLLVLLGLGVAARRRHWLLLAALLPALTLLELLQNKNLRYTLRRAGVPRKVARAWDGEPVGIAYMVLKSGEQGQPWTAERPRRIAERLATDPHLARVFPVIGTFPLPDGSTATVRARRLDDG